MALALSSIAAAAWLGAPPVVARYRSAALMSEVKPTASAAEEQMREYFELATWEKKPEFDLGGRATTLDLRAFVQPFNRSGAVVAGVYFTQDGLPRTVGVPTARPRAPVGWRCVGAVAALDEASIPLAIAKQRDLIVQWAYELLRDYKTDERMLRLGRDAPLVRLAWSYPPNGLRYTFDKAYEGDQVEVPLDTPVDESVRCGFLGSQCRSKASQGGGFSFVPIELPE